MLACRLALGDNSTISAGAEMPGDVIRGRERLADVLGHPQSLAELANVAGWSKYQLLRRFERAHGMTPHRWLRQVRVERARAAIRRDHHRDGQDRPWMEASSVSESLDVAIVLPDGRHRRATKMKHWVRVLTLQLKAETV